MKSQERSTGPRALLYHIVALIVAYISKVVRFNLKRVVRIGVARRRGRYVIE